MEVYTITTGDSLVIRPFEEKDRSAVINYSLPEEQAIYTSFPINVIEESKSDRFIQPYVIYFNRVLMGFFALNAKAGNVYTSNENAIVLRSFSIDSRFQRKGLALETFSMLPEILKKRYPDKNEMILTFHYTNIPARNLYKKAGFIDRGLRYEGEHGEEWIFHYGLLI
jgi:RimJ/RimL family protein N-acetyltransferase